MFLQKEVSELDGEKLNGLAPYKITEKGSAGPFKIFVCLMNCRFLIM